MSSANHEVNMSIDDHDDEEFDDDDDDDDAAASLVLVELGLVRKPETPLLLRSKAGGAPAWLNPINLPSGKSCLCDICRQPLRFLLQIYTPLYNEESKSEPACSRTVYVFMCTSMSCLLRDQHEQWKHHPDKASRSIKVFRCQHPNRYHSGSENPLGTAAPLCSWCGTWKGDKVCSSCKRARCCSKTHQAIHWRSAHKTQCRTIDLTSSSSEDVPKAASNDTWPEFEIITEEESEPDSDSELSGFNAYENALRSDHEDEGDARSWTCFTQRIAWRPAQVLRYSRDSEPLWPMLSGRPSKPDIPKCSSCGGDRAFEFQILPQLLHYFRVKNEPNSLDWATIAVYTCEASCDGSQSYEEEFPWVQITSS